MLMYYINGENNYLIRTENITNYVSGLTYLNLENMSDGVLHNILLDESYTNYEQTLEFSLNLEEEDIKDGEQFRCLIKYDNKIIWRGSLSIGNIQPQNKMEYETKINDVIVTDNYDYIVIEN